MRIGYARFARLEKLPYSQLDVLRAAGCKHVFEDHGVSAIAVSKPRFEAALREACPGDTFVVCSLDRLARNLPDLIALIGEIQAAGLGFVSLADEIDTEGEPVSFYRIVRALEHFARGAARDRRLAEEAARIVGRKPSITDTLWATIKDALLQPWTTIASTAAEHDVSRQAIYSRLAHEVSEAEFAAYQMARAVGEDRAVAIQRLGLYKPAIDYRESRIVAAQLLEAA